MKEASARTHIVSIHVEDLFGQYSYDLKPKAECDALSQLFILYGENGTGKTTILWLLDHLLSKELGAGHRTFLAKTQFKIFAVNLSDGLFLSASRARAEAGNYTMTMRDGNKEWSYEYIVDKDGAVSSSHVKNDPIHEAFRSVLPNLRITVLADDRKVSSASVPREFVRGRDTELWAAIRSEELAVKNPSALQPALNALREWARSRALDGSNLGQRDVNVIYIDLLKRLSRANESPESLAEITDKLRIQGKRSSLFGRFGLASEIDVGSIIEVIASSPHTRQSVMAQVIKPYLDSNEARFAALNLLQRTLATFVDDLNTVFFKNKEIRFDLKQGVQIISGGQPLDSELLSSGEKQLLVLFCNVVQASDRQSIFIIDEPELSLNVDWQRHLIDALQRLASENVQFVFATHSLELLSRHRNSVARLVHKERERAVSSSPVEGEQE